MLCSLQKLRAIGLVPCRLSTSTVVSPDPEWLGYNACPGGDRPQQTLRRRETDSSQIRNCVFVKRSFRVELEAPGCVLGRQIHEVWISHASELAKVRILHRQRYQCRWLILGGKPSMKSTHKKHTPYPCQNTLLFPHTNRKSLPRYCCIRRPSSCRLGHDLHDNLTTCCLFCSFFPDHGEPIECTDDIIYKS